jgi:hypothetical protein
MGFFNNKIIVLLSIHQSYLMVFFFFFGDKDKWAIYFAMLAFRQDFGLNAQMCKIV